MKIALILLWFGLVVSSLADKEPKLWQDGRITPEQPFKAVVIGVIPGWGGDTLILKEIEKPGKYCMAHLVMHQFLYRVISEKEVQRIKEVGHATFISPGVEVNRFSWSMGIHTLGRRFGKDDFVRQWYPKSQPAKVEVIEE